MHRLVLLEQVELWEMVLNQTPTLDPGADRAEARHPAERLTQAVGVVLAGAGHVKRCGPADFNALGLLGEPPVTELRGSLAVLSPPPSEFVSLPRFQQPELNQ
jgi:hypothetical protein